MFVLIGEAGGPRVEGFLAAWAALGLAPGRVISYGALIRGETHLAEHVRSGDIIRIESAERSFEVEKLLLTLGAAVADTYPSIPPPENFDKGRIWGPRQWYVGFCRFLALIKNQLADCPPHYLMNPPDDIALMFDKPACQARFADAGQPIPRPLGLIEDGPQCRAAAQSKGGGRVFLKLAHGSAGSGVMAYRWSGQGQQAVTSVQVELGQGGEVKLYNTRHLETLTQAGEIDRLIEHLGRHRLYGETWMPKASLRGKSFDLRVLVIAGQVAHSVARLSKGPITNLHLLNERLNIEAALEDIPAALWEDIQKTCCHLMGVCFPKSLYAGFDVMISGGMQHYYVLEANAFGDLLKGVYHQGRDTYTQEILAMLERGSC